MAKNEKAFQLNQYGSEVQQAITDALTTLPEQISQRPTYSEVLYFGRTIPFTPTKPYEPVPKIYLDEANSATNQRLDAEIARATAAEKNLNEKHILTYASNTYKYINLSTLNNATQALVDENALDQKLASLSLGFFVFYQVKADGTLVEESKDDSGSNPYSIVATAADLPTTGVPDGALALVLKNDTNIDVYKYASNAWSVLSTPVIENGWLFAEESTGHGFYWFQNTWNKVDMNVDMSEYYKKTEIDGILTGYVKNTTLGSLSSLNTTAKNTIVAAINEVNTTAKAKDTLPIIPSYSVLANATNADDKPTTSYKVTSSSTAKTLAFRTTTGTLKAADAVEDNDLVPLKQVKDLITGTDMTGYQPIIAAGTANNIVAYSGTAGTLNTLTRSTIIATSPIDTQIPTAKATKTYVDAYKPVIITQGSSSTSVTTTQLTFWVES